MSVCPGRNILGHIVEGHDIPRWKALAKIKTLNTFLGTDSGATYV